MQIAPRPVMSDTTTLVDDNQHQSHNPIMIDTSAKVSYDQSRTYNYASPSEPVENSVSYTSSTSSNNLIDTTALVDYIQPNLLNDEPQVPSITIPAEFGSYTSNVPTINTINEPENKFQTSKMIIDFMNAWINS